MWLDKLKVMRIESGKTTKEIATATGLPKSTLDKLFTGVTKEPPLSTISTVVHYFGYTLDDLMGDNQIYTPSEKEILSKYQHLDSYGQKAVKSILDVEYERCIEATKTEHLTEIRTAAYNGTYRIETVTDSQKQALIDKINSLPDVDDLE